MTPPNMTQRALDLAVVQGWKDAAVAARESLMVAFYDRLLVALRDGAA